MAREPWAQEGAIGMEETRSERETDGRMGTDGTDGTNGMDGVDGTDGADGTNGTDGANGTDGTNGMDGMNGTDGTNGTDGVEDGKCPCRQKKTERSEEEHKKLIHRLSRIEGQIRGIKGMVENDAYCTDILTQSAAASAAINAFNRDLLASHIRSCVARDIREGKDEVIDDLVATIQKLMK